MHKLLWATAALALSLSFAQAQTAAPAAIATPQQQVPEHKMVKDPSARAARMADKLTAQFSLNASQREQVYAAFMNQFQQVDKLREEGDVKGKVKEVHATTDAKLRTILGDEHFERYQQMRQERKEDRHERKGNMMAPSPAPMPAPAPSK